MWKQWGSVYRPLAAGPSSVSEMPLVRDNPLDEIKSWRDKMLMKILNLELKLR